MNPENKKKEQIIFFGVSLTMLLVFVIWISTLRFPQAKSVGQQFDLAAYKQQFDQALSEAEAKLAATQKKTNASSTEPSLAEVKARIEALSKDLEAKAGTSTLIVASSSTSTAQELELEAMKKRLAEIEIKLNDKK